MDERLFATSLKLLVMLEWLWPLSHSRLFCGESSPRSRIRVLVMMNFARGRLVRHVLGQFWCGRRRLGHVLLS